MKLKGKAAIITGGGTGIGRAAAIALAGEGARVAVMGRRPGPLNETVDKIREIGGEGLALPSDVTVIEDIEKARDKVRETYGRLDILINNAGSALFKPFMKTSLEEFDRIYQVDLRSVFAVSQLMLPLMLEGGGGSIINISSILGVLGGRNSSAYCAMKGGVVQLTRALAAELGPGIRVNCLCPSHIITPMMEDELSRIESKGKMDKLTKMFPMKRLAYPEDMTGSILFFASDDSKWLTGNILMIDGGLSCYI
ncbi:MAG: SDR family NAD(P)-dependent oxidoreductase [Syntrophomonas sp.]|uniref:SDR family NAD(P)-dependent oxidoreductase n=1 Tax=Syntrophomonas sp. TaxID=2053627 RepID=UPI00260AC024|nr:SDR family oxidoreductase [Syntrophomonas sp.]MDD2511315.1 SDR family NAD(P)-dependent oxidoreductase [Syntrophomonas sp.]MDD3878783.1 SDR family NAD(P)-dependent oxidoreductase [Syntrophomonas sp.]MDD4625920.1 SDR family NAD(P)-dependent oxidoreductase [Syntrophomonas sp.]